jgi:hypothetical protein
MISTEPLSKERDGIAAVSFFLNSCGKQMCID